MTHYSPYAGISSGHNYLSEPTCIILLQNSFSSHSQTWQVRPALCSTWIWSGSRVAWSHCGWPCPWSVDVSGRRSGSLRHTSTGVCRSWSWPAGTQTCAPAHDPAQTGNKHRQPPCVCVCLYAGMCLWRDTHLIVVLHHDQRESTLFKVQPGDFGPGGHTETHKWTTKPRTLH